jgi:hypothetical protein
MAIQVTHPRVIARPKAVAGRGDMDRHAALSMNTQGTVSNRCHFKRLVCGGRPICARLAP